MSKAASENVLPLVTDCGADSVVVEYSAVVAVGLLTAQCEALSVPVTLPPLIASTVVLRPFGARSAGPV